MATDRVTGPGTALPIGPTGASATMRAEQAVRPTRLVASFSTGLGGLLLVAGLFASSSWSWLLWIVVGVLAGAVAARPGLVWLTWLGVAGFYPIGASMGIVRGLGPFWWMGAVIGAALVSAGFLFGTVIGLRYDPWTAVRRAWRASAARARFLLLGLIALVLGGFGVYTVYAGALGSGAIVDPPATAKAQGCDTPMQRFGWAYEAINYDIADDARLAAANPDPARCTSQGDAAATGREVVTSDGIPIAGWYIPAADASVGPDGPTLVIVHGWKANKSVMLEAAPPFHDAYNLVLMDLRGSGRSGDAPVTWGAREQHDVRAMIDWLERVKHPTWIGGMGVSMGAATLLAEAVSDSRVEALILDSLHGRAHTSIGNGAEVENGHPSLPVSWATVVGVYVRTGEWLPSVDPVSTIAQLGDRPVLLIHGTDDVLDRPADSPEVNFHSALEAGVPVELQYCRGGGHGGLIDRCPAEWSRWVSTFLAAAIAG